MADLPDIFADSDSADSENPFDVEIEKYEKQLQLARYRKKYRNAWPYITNRWQDAHINIKEAERVLRNFRLGYAAHYAEERRQHKFLYDVYTNFIRGLHSKHDKLHKKVKARFAQMDDLLEKFKGLPSGVKLVLSSLD